MISKFLFPDGLYFTRIMKVDGTVAHKFSVSKLRVPVNCERMNAFTLRKMNASINKLIRIKYVVELVCRIEENQSHRNGDNVCVVLCVCVFCLIACLFVSLCVVAVV